MLDQTLEFLNQPIAGNAFFVWMKALLWVVLAVGLMRVVVPKVVAKLEVFALKTSSNWDDAAVNALVATRWRLIALMALGPASNELELLPIVERWCHGLALVALFIQIGLWVASFLDTWIRSARKQGLEVDPSATSALSMLSFIARAALWSILLLVLLSNFGFDVNTLVAGFGIGGIAIGLAVQNILGDLFASLSIVLDKPFQVGDFIIIDEYCGTVDNIGLKATRIRSLSGEMLVFSNTDLTKARLRNYKTMEERRIVFNFSVTYATTTDQLEALPNALKTITESVDSVRFDRAHLKGFSPSGLDFELVYWMTTPDYNHYMDAQQIINLALLRKLSDDGVQLAVPIRSLVLDKDSKPAINMQVLAPEV
jgi:small-conductance mechanosensitive channel